MKHLRHANAVIPRLLIFVCVFTLFLTASFLAEAKQDGSQKTPSAFREKLFDVTFKSPTEAFVVGYPGVLLRTKDAGATWTRIKVPTDEPLFDIDFVDDKFGWIVGRNGLVLSTKDGGMTWAKQTTTVEQPLFAVHFFDQSKGIAVGHFGTIATTEDGGNTWKSEEFPLMRSAGIHNVFFFNADTGFFVGEYPYWETELSEDVTEDDISNMFKTTDGGKTWERVATNVPKTLYDILFINDNLGYAVGKKGTLIISHDGGETWKKLETPYDNLFTTLTHQGDRVFATGTEGVILEINGESVKMLNSKVFTWLSGIEFGDENHGIAVGARGAILYTADGGKTWKKQPIN